MTTALQGLSELRQEIVALGEDRQRVEDSLLRPKKMIGASLSFIPNYCGKKRTVAAGEVSHTVHIRIYPSAIRGERA